MDVGDLFGPGRAGREGAGEVLPLTADDLGRLAEPRAAERGTLTRLRHKHHALARALANGMSQGEAGIVSGFTASTVSILLTDPTFAELVRFYEGETAKSFNAIQEALAGVSMAALEEIADRLDTQPEKLSITVLKELAQMGADRTGNGPSTTQTVNVNHGLADRMLQAQKRLEASKFHAAPVDQVEARSAVGPTITYSDITPREAAE